MAVVTLHGHRHRPRVAALIALDPAEQLGKAFRAVIDVKLFQQLPRGQPHGNAVAMTADIDGLSHQHNEYFVGMLMTLAEKYLNGNVLFMWVSAEHNGVKYTKFQKPMLHSLYDQAAVAHG